MTLILFLEMPHASLRLAAMITREHDEGEQRERVGPEVEQVQHATAEELLEEGLLRAAAALGSGAFAEVTEGFSGAELANIVNEAAISAVRAGEPHVQAGARLRGSVGARSEGAGSNTLTVEGVERLSGALHTAERGESTRGQLGACPRLRRPCLSARAGSGRARQASQRGRTTRQRSPQ